MKNISELRKEANKKRILAYGFAGVCAVLIIGVIIFTVSIYRADPNVYSATESLVEEQSEFFKIRPDSNIEPEHTIVFLPGGLVEAEAYVANMSEISWRTNSQIYIVKAPLNLAILNTGQGSSIIEEEGLDNVIIGGHSLGGVVACKLTKANMSKISTLFLWASYCDESITEFQGEVYSLYGQNDTVLNIENFNQSKGNLPLQNTTINIQKGLNHAAFGSYGEQRGDGTNEIEREELISIFIQNLGIEEKSNL